MTRTGASILVRLKGDGIREQVCLEKKLKKFFFFKITWENVYFSGFAYEYWIYARSFTSYDDAGRIRSDTTRPDHLTWASAIGGDGSTHYLYAVRQTSRGAGYSATFTELGCSVAGCRFSNVEIVECRVPPNFVFTSLHCSRPTPMLESTLGTKGEARIAIRSLTYIRTRSRRTRTHYDNLGYFFLHLFRFVFCLRPAPAADILAFVAIGLVWFGWVCLGYLVRGLKLFRKTYARPTYRDDVTTRRVALHYRGEIAGSR